MTVKYKGMRFTGDALTEYVLANMVMGQVEASTLPALSWITPHDLHGIDLCLTTYIHEAAAQMENAVAARADSDALVDILRFVKWADIVDFMYDAEQAVAA